jgi:hypothetical protein
MLIEVRNRAAGLFAKRAEGAHHLEQPPVLAMDFE